ncbi:ABC transporter permease [Occallatibacter riparius]|uniref:ABC transporter permease n=1 Tax=Occallatibacter riparius TaxID=1002689 RepID=A0A9J7BRN0_9BACT|nr:ABC transporter permease [Occallatibacter riparius]UWZ85548.1 ABC transporter permease [Occallatibacter riparius]
MSRSLPRIGRSARALARAPGLSFALLLTIALGVGSNAAVYGFLQGLTHPDSPVRGDRIVSIFTQDRFRAAGPLSSEEYRNLQSTKGLFDWVGAARIEPARATIDHRSGIRTVAAVTPSLAAVLAFPLNSGVVISHRIWENELGRRQDAVGSSIRIDDADLRIDGVAPERLDGFYNDERVDLWIESRSEDPRSVGVGRHDLWVVARLRPGVSVAKAQASLRSGSTGLGNVSVTLFTGIAPGMALGLARVGMFLNFSAAAVFFIACINVASFLLGRALKRTHETSLRIALGATRSELLGDLFADSAILSIAGGAIGLWLGILTTHALPALLFKEDAEQLTFATHLLPIFAASLACIGITMVCGMLPVVGTVTDRPWTVLQREAGSPSKAIQRLRSALVVGQMTACCTLVICTALLLAGLHEAFETSAGHRLGDPILLTVQAPTRPDGPEIDFGYFGRVEQGAKSVPGLSPLAWAARVPGNRPTWRTFRIQKFSQKDRHVAMDISWLTPSSLQLLTSPPAAGRMFDPADQRGRVAIVNEEAATELFGRQSVGVAIRDSSGSQIEIIGVVKRKSTETRQQRRPTIYYGFINQTEEPSTIRNADFLVALAPPVTGIELSANVASANYFRALDMTTIAGRIFSDDRIAGQPRVAVVNQEAADLYFDHKPLGAGVIDESGVRTEIIGVVRSQAVGTFERHGEPAIYFPMWQDYPPRMTLMLKHSKWNDSMAAGLRSRVENVPGNTFAPTIKTLATQLAQSGLAGLRVATLIGGVSAVTGLVLSLLGLLSAQSDAERQRQRDRALCMALGAQRWRIVLMVLSTAVRLAIFGTVIGTALSFALLKFLIAGITGVASPPVQVWLIAPLLPAAATMIASMLPARRASVLSPSVILRDS